jgi:D-alanine-D-alanine ligase
MVADSLARGGHDVILLEADLTLLEQLDQFMPPDAQTGAPTGMVFNMSYGIQGDARYTHVPAMLEMAGVPYTGSCPLGQSLSLDKVVTKILMRDAGVDTPAYRVFSKTTLSQHAGDEIVGLRYPLIVKPRHESTSYGLRLVHHPSELQAAVAVIMEEFQQAALVEEYIDGREICIGILGNETIEFLPPLELDFGGRGLRMMTWEDKYHKRPDEPQKICPAPLTAAEVERLNELALKTFRACDCRDYARVDFRIDRDGRPFALEINSMASLGGGGSYVTSALTAGYDFSALVGRILDIAHLRYFGCLAPCRVRVAEPVLANISVGCTAQVTSSSGRVSGW